MLTGVRGMTCSGPGSPSLGGGVHVGARIVVESKSVVGRRSYGWVVAISAWATSLLVGIGVAYLVLHGGPSRSSTSRGPRPASGWARRSRRSRCPVMAGGRRGSRGPELSPTLLMDTLGIALGAGLGGAARSTIVTRGGGSLTTGLSFGIRIASARQSMGRLGGADVSIDRARRAIRPGPAGTGHLGRWADARGPALRPQGIRATGG